MAVSASLRALDRLKKKRQAIHVARRQLDLDDESYRLLLKRVAGVKSSADLNSIDKADAVLDELSRLGFQHKPKITPGRHKGTPTTLEREPYLQKIEALLADMQLPWAYAEKIGENVTGGKKPESIKRLEWIHHDSDLRAIIAALHQAKKKRLLQARQQLNAELGKRGLTAQWARRQAEEMGRLMTPWPWADCLDTLRQITARLPKGEVT